jgi:hypothetical protein
MLFADKENFPWHNSAAARLITTGPTMARGKTSTRSFHIPGDELPRLLVEEVRDDAIITK